MSITGNRSLSIGDAFHLSRCDSKGNFMLYFIRKEAGVLFGGSCEEYTLKEEKGWQRKILQKRH